MKYYYISDTKYVASGVNCLYSSLLCSWQCICITQKPHDYLYKKSGQWSIEKFCPWVLEFTNKMKYLKISNTEYVASEENCLYSLLLCLWQCICITQKPHDHSYKKSWQWGVAKFCTRLEDYTKLMKYYWISEIKYVASGVHCLYYSLLCSWQCVCITQKPHDHLYKKSWQWGIAKFCTRLEEYTKLMKYYWISDTKYVDRG